ncbi:nucleoside hydrolase [Devosia sp. Leaf64]|uniref:nucleoside hydrolase n=1 Tax=Devosia sp. Leaf64 TaxID=1736229 RepID=UPI00071546DF|nr:nucleoside hydrolase [Devosia sp. Leaf64]KQN70182.1 nucleoside hydrolase [Devosia sp. Leaf64]
MPRKIIIDTDPGQDDAVAILLALASPEDFEVVGVVAVAGNVGLHHNATNARKIVELAGRPDVPVYAGCSRPMRRTLVTAEHVHGDTGLNGPDLPAPKIELQPQHGVDYIIDALMSAEPKSITLCTLGPLTNIAMALVKEPRIAERVAELVMMGGAYFEVGNITPAAEFNIYVDPDAADIVFRSGIKLTVLPLDVTHQMQSTPARLNAIKAIGNKSGQAVYDMLTFSEGFDLKKYGWDGAPLHDPTVIACLIDPTIFEGRECNVTIETTSELTIGMTVTDYWHVTDKPKNATYIRSGNADRFYDLLTERLARLP